MASHPYIVECVSAVNLVQAISSNAKKKCATQHQTQRLPWITALEQTRLTPHYQGAKALLQFHKDDVHAMFYSADNSAEESFQRSEHMSKLPTEHSMGGAWIFVNLKAWTKSSSNANLMETILGRMSCIDVPRVIRQWRNSFANSSASKVRVMDLQLTFLPFLGLRLGLLYEVSMQPPHLTATKEDAMTTMGAFCFIYC